MRLGGPQIRSGGCGKEKNLALPGIKVVPLLYRLTYPDSSTLLVENGKNSIEDVH
jgi:hypothetical protein